MCRSRGRSGSNAENWEEKEMKRNGTSPALAAINEAAQEKKMSYGLFVAVTPKEELERIVSEYKPKPKGITWLR